MFKVGRQMTGMFTDRVDYCCSGNGEPILFSNFDVALEYAKKHFKNHRDHTSLVWKVD